MFHMGPPSAHGMLGNMGVGNIIMESLWAHGILARMVATPAGRPVGPRPSGNDYY